MYGLNHLPPIQNAISVTEFIGAKDAVVTNNNGWSVYSVPQSATFIYVLCIGPGGNGGTPIVGAATSGGGGGGSGAIVKALLPVMLIPRTLYIFVGGSVTSGVQTTLVSVYPTDPGSSVDNFIISADDGGRGAVAGTAGAAGAVMTVASAKLAGTLALWVSQVGVAGGAGSTTNGAAVTALATLPLTGGGGGGGSSAGTGGNITGAGPFPTISGGASGANPGIGGMMLRQPFGGVGGSGGGGVNAAGTGLNFGGAGAIGCGGGGGGNAASGTPGAGGKGGPGYCLIVAF